ncbi:MAG TPA: kelch repeat-containing protein [Anaerolineaceae bacterium]|nr:kelch repeat-containing protein [Anaerolineaceae bacterium]
MEHKRSSPDLVLIRVILAFGLMLLAMYSLPPGTAQASLGTWTPTDPMQYGRYGHTSTLLIGGPDSGKVLVAGGTLEVTLPGIGGLPGSQPMDEGSGDPPPTGQTAELYDPAAQGTHWSLTAPLNTPRIFHTATLIAPGKVLVAGGANTQTQASLNTAEIFDTTGGSPIWTLTPNNMAHPHTSATATLLDDGKVLIVGGYSGSVASGDATNTVEIYDPSNPETPWSSAAPLNHARAFHTATLIHPNGASYGMVLVAGGSSSAISGWGEPMNSVERYDPVANTWTNVKPLLTARTDHSATLLENGTVLVVGGNGPNTGEDETHLTSAEIYNPDANTWTETTSPLPTARGNHTATLLENGPQNGKVLIAGGSNSVSLVTDTVLFDPATQTWLDSGTMSVGRVSHTATVLSNGQVLLTGGFLGIGAPTSADNSAELYIPILSQTITITKGAPDAAAYRTTFTVSATASSNLTVTYSSGNPAICTVVTAEDQASATFTMQSGTGICPVQYDQAGNADYEPASRVTQYVNAQKIDQSITITQDAPSNAIYQTTFQVAATASSGLSVNYSSGNPDVCTVDSAGTFTMQKGTGICKVQYDQPGNSNFNPASQKTKNVTAEKKDQYINFSVTGERPYGTDFSIAAIADSYLLTTFIPKDGDPCTIANSEQDPISPDITHAMVHPTDLGGCTLTAVQNGDENYNPAAPVTQSVTIIKGDQTITITILAPASAAYHSTFTVEATASSNLAVTYSSGSPEICSNEKKENEFTILKGSGTCIIRFDQAGDDHYNSAPQEIQSVIAVKAAQSITVTASAPSSAAYLTTFNVAAESSSGRAVEYSSRSPAICSVNTHENTATFTMLTGTGTCLVQFDQSGDENYESAATITQQVIAQKLSQNITFEPIDDIHTFGDPDISITAVSDSGLTVSISLGEKDPCTLTGTQLHIDHAGICTITFSQSGDDNFEAAIQVQKQITLLKKTISILLINLSHIVDGQPKAVTAVPEINGLTVVVTYTAKNYGPTTQPPSKIGTYTVNAVIDDRDYQGSATAEMTILSIQVYLPVVVHP